MGADVDNFIEVSLNLERDQLIARNITTQEYGEDYLDGNIDQRLSLESSMNTTMRHSEPG